MDALKVKELILAMNYSTEEVPNQSFLLCSESESTIRLRLQELIDKHGITASIMVNGNTVWSKERILRNLRRIIRHGRLYDKNRPLYYPLGSLLRLPAGGDPILSKYFYSFLHLHCGSIAHYSIQGWIATYPTLGDLKEFFKKNEYGRPVREYIPWWMTDALNIVDAIERELFPLRSYIRAQKKPQYY